MAKRTDLVQAIQSIPWFIDMQIAQIERLANIAGIRSLEAGEVLFLEGDREVCMYVILEGQINLENYVPAHGVLYLYTADPLDILGWSSMTPVVRQLTASARALCPCRLLAFDSDALKRLCEEDHDLGFIIMRRMANVVASQLLVSRLVLYDLIVKLAQDQVSQPPASQSRTDPAAR
jgi:CRP/FNR family transcriptional regulator, cyclic AMP receptor protein